MLTSIDLFSGIGGFALALRSCCLPLLYCDINPRSCAVLTELMKKGWLPSATIVRDVCNLDLILNLVGNRQVDVVTAGFPCVGFSCTGAKAGLNNVHSALFFAMMHVIKALRPTLVILENVIQVLTSNEGNDFKTIVHHMHESGYDMRWTLTSAREVGAPQVRRRWYAICTKVGSEVPPLAVPSWKNAEWVARDIPPLVVGKQASGARRFSMLGNAVVPVSVRYALTKLYTNQTDSELVNVPPVLSYKPFVSDADMFLSTNALGGFSRDGVIYTRKTPLPRSISHEQSSLITLTGDHYATLLARQHAVHRVPLPTISKKVLSCWPTPRTQAATHSHTLTSRTAYDLPTCVMYASMVGTRAQKRTDDSQAINPNFVEWLMGYPKDWTTYADC
jgi:DNA-cytosine methyltransferase